MKYSLRTKRGLVALLALLLFVSAPFAAFAEDPPVATPPPPTGDTPAPTGGGISAGTLVSCTAGLVLTAGIPCVNAGVQSVLQSAGITIDPLGDAVSATGSAIISAVAFFILGFANLLLGIAGALFNWVVVKTVFGFATFLGNSPGLLLAWRILRDIGNMLLLFGFIFIGIAMILDLHSYPAKKALPRLIIFAILMNFSLFIAEAVIDTSNVLSSVLYSQTNTGDCIGQYNQDAANSTDTASNAARENLESSCFVNTGIAGHIMEATGLSSIFAADNNGVALQASAMIGLALFATVGAVVLFAGSMMLISRAVVLALLMVAAPLGFAALAIPPLEKHGKDWWNRLLSQSFFAPVFLLLIFVSLKISDSFAGTGTSGSLAGALTQPNSSVMGIFLVFFLICGFLIASLIAAKKFGAAGASFAVNSATGFTSRVMGGAIFGGAGFVGRQTIGKGGDAVARAIRSSGLVQTNPNLARYLTKPFDKAKAASFDARTTKTLQAGTKGVGNGFNLGKPGKDAAKGFRGTTDATKKALDELEKSSKATPQQKGVGEELEKELEDLKKAEREHAPIANALKEVEEQRVKVAQARLGNDGDALEEERKILRDKIKSYYEAKDDPSNPYNEVIGSSGKDKDGKDIPIYRGKAIEEEAKAWKKYGEQEKTRVFLEEGLQPKWYNKLPGTLSELEIDEIRESVKKDRNTDTLTKALNKIAAGDSTPPTTPAPGTTL